MFEALQKRDPQRAEKLGRWAVACDPDNIDAHRNLGLALAQQGKAVDALHHLTRGTRQQSTQVLAGVLFQQGKLAEALTVLDFASRWYTTAEQWLGFGGIADAAADRIRAERAYARAYRSRGVRCQPARGVLARVQRARETR
jgi:predicted Zn-dependent protease